MSELEKLHQPITGISATCLNVRLTPDNKRIFSPHDKNLFLKVTGKTFIPATLEELYKLAELCEKQGYVMQMKDGDEAKLS